MAIAVNFGALNVGSLSNNTGIFIGSNNQVGWDSQTKFSQANGQFNGANGSVNNFNILLDSDIIDAPANIQNVKPGFQNQQV
ncbi:hypothetical protein [Ammoniphilus sp. YIM 78166]|uniref:hypothetical protein n=1 Tax=Ammoniphilus sp. YIM 78166 TaxID=1644106 RepID=UPI00106F2B69|nr:hypothetical protein [Ammoniphilus sp. YIM 78166]